MQYNSVSPSPNKCNALDEYFEYDAEEFLVSLALLITEGRTPECSVKGRTESFHCPPAQSCYPATTKHECSDKLAQCRQARRTRSEVSLLWKNNLPIMVEVMLLPDCCYSDDGPTTEGIDLNDPAIKQDALLLERWILEPVPRQSGDRFIEEKTLLLAVRSFVFFSQLSAWLSVSHGAIPRNILYRISAADVDLQWNFSQTPIEHVFPVPNVSHNVALKVSVQSLPRQSNYPVLTCSIHTNIGLYEKRIQEHELKAHQHRNSNEAEQCSTNSSQRLCSKQSWALAPENAKNGTTSEYTAAVKNVKLYPGTGNKSDYGTCQANILGFSGRGDRKSHETPVRTLKSFSMIDSSVSSHQSSWPSVGETNPLIGSLIQDRQEVIARIAQHLIHCDPSTSHVPGHPFNMQESSSLNSKLFRVAQENENVRKCKEPFSISFGSPELSSSEDTSEGKIQVKTETLRSATGISDGLYSRQSVGETNPLIGSLLQERQDVIARIAQHLEHIDPTASHLSRQSFNMHDSSSVPSKVFRSLYEDKNLLKKNKDDTSISISNTKFSFLEDSSEGTNLIPKKSLSSFKCDSKVKSSLKPQIRNLYQDNPSEIIQNTFQERQNKTAGILTPSNMPHCKKNNLDLTVRLENTLSECQFKEQEISNETDKQYSNCNNIEKQICTNKYKEKIKNENCNPESFNNDQFEDSKKNDSKIKTAMLEMSGYLNKHENKCSNKDFKRPKTCEQNNQLNSIENYLSNNEVFKCKKPDQLKNEQDKKEETIDEKFQNCSQRKNIKNCLSTCERLKSTEALQKTIPLKHSSVWRKHNFHSLDGISTRAFHPRTGLPLLSSPVPQRKTQSGCFDLDSSLLHLKSLSSRSPRPCLNIEDDPDIHEKPFLSSSAPPITSLSLLGNFEESVLNYRLDPLGIVDGFTAEVGASGVFCPTHLTLPVEVSFYSVSDDNAPSPYMGVITLESLGKRGYRVPPSGTIQVTLFNPNKTVVKMFVVIYDLRDMPANHQTFLRQRTFSVPVKQEMKRSVNKENIRHTEERLLRYLIHLRFQSSKSGKIYLHRDVRLLFSRKSMEVDSGAAYELKSYTESPTNPQFSPRC
ncbi:protein FAM214A isoform X1 [Canis lupus dingo]|uniref:Atos homolog protein A n=1 Tax=Canis lupus familiaris TaxID=9615 RepID=A0A8C0NFA7_CANLF|nr:protein FAM214A isoform X1 [Canis lupus dingo]